MAVNKVVYGTTTLVDLTADTVTADTLAEGYTAHDAAGNAILGTMVSAKLAATYNEDGTQNLLIADDDTVFDLASLTADADATAEDVAEGKVFYAQGVRRVGANVPVDPAPVLLWTNASPTSAFDAQTITVAEAYAGYIVECRGSTSNAITRKVFFANGEEFSVVIPSNNTFGPGRCAARNVECVGNTISFTSGLYQSTSSNTTSTGDGYCIPTRIWGVKFTL